MLNGGVITSLALSNNAFSAFVENKTSSNGVFGVAEDLRDTARGDLSMHAVFCYGWWDNMSDANDGYWLCKNSWGSNWGLGGSFRAAYGAANLMQPDYTFALQYNRANPLARARQIRQQLKLSLAFESSSQSACLLYTPQQPQRLVKLMDDLTALADTAAVSPGMRLRKADVLADLVASNLGTARKLSAASRGPFRLCDARIVQLLKSLVTAPSPSPSPIASPAVMPSTSPAAAVPSPSPPPSNLEGCSPERAADPSCQRCAWRVALGFSHSCIQLFTGSVVCAGENDAGELGLGKPDLDDRRTFIAATALAGISVSGMGAGEQFTCVLAAPMEGANPSSANTVHCFGAGDAGQMGDGSGTGSAAVATVQGLRLAPKISQLVVGPYAACVVYDADASGQRAGGVPLHCWGAMYGATPMEIKGTGGTTALAMGMYKACVLLKDQTVACWDASPTPAKVPGLSNVVRIAAGEKFACAVVRPAGAAGVLWCWGKDAYGGFASNSSNPVRVTGLPGSVLDVVAGSAHACALVATAGSGGGQVYCWGANEYGVLGQGYTNGTTGNAQGSRVPLRVKGLENVTALFGTYSANCAIVASRSLLCWGSNYNGQLGTEPVLRNIVTLPTAVKGLCA